MGAALNRKTPRISVVMPVVRVDAYVAPAIQSVLSQQEINIELLLIGPQLNEPAFEQLQKLIKTQCSNDSRCTLIPRREHGIANALNLGLEQASGEYIARMDADDLCEPNRFQQQLATARSHKDHCLVSACVKIFSNEKTIQQGNQQYETWLNETRTPESIRHSCFVESPLPHPTWFAHKSVWTKMGPYQQADFPEDYDRVLSAWLHNIPMIKPNDVLLHWREHTNRLTRTDTRYRREAFTELKAKALADPRSGLHLNQGRSVWIAGTGRNARYWHDALEKYDVNVAGFVDLNGPHSKKQKRHKPVIRYETLAATLKDDLLITAITNADARENLKHWCATKNLVMGDNVVIGG